MDRTQAQLLVEELENKKDFEASYDFRCDGCESMIYEGDNFTFLGNKKRVCDDCMGTMIESLGAIE